MSTIDATGTIPSLYTIYEDESCDAIDEAATRELVGHILEADVGGLLTGGHGGEVECLTMGERVRRLQIALEEVDGRVPVWGGIMAHSTWEAIEQGKRLEEAGADGLLLCPPEIVSWDPEAGHDFLVEHAKAFAAEVDLPLMLFGAENPGIGGTYYSLAETFGAIVEAVDTVAAVKITSMYDTAVFRRTAAAVKEADESVATLLAGSQNNFEAYLNGAEGNVTGAGNFLFDLDAQQYHAFQAGDLDTVYEIARRKRPLTDVVYGHPVSKPMTPYHYRYKSVAWLRGLIPRPYMRLPQQPLERDEIHELAEAVEAAGFELKRDPDDCPLSVAAGSPTSRRLQSIEGDD